MEILLKKFDPRPTIHDPRITKGNQDAPGTGERSCLCAAVSFEFKAPWFVETPDLPKFPEQP